MGKACLKHGGKSKMSQLNPGLRPDGTPCIYIIQQCKFSREFELRTDACVDGHEDDARRRGHLLAHPEQEAEHGERADKKA